MYTLNEVQEGQAYLGAGERVESEDGLERTQTFELAARDDLTKTIMLQAKPSSPGGSGSEIRAGQWCSADSRGRWDRFL